MSCLKRTVFAVPALVVALGLLVQAGALVSQHLLYTRAYTEVSFWGREHYQPTEATQSLVSQQISALLQANAKHPDYLTLQAQRAAWQSQWQAQARPAQPLQQNTTLNAQYGALESRPARPQDWQLMVTYAQRSSATRWQAVSFQRRLQELQRFTAE